MNVQRYNPDADTKDTRRSLMRPDLPEMGEVWVHALRDHSAFLADFDHMARVSPGQLGDLLRNQNVTITHAQWTRTRGVFRFDPTFAEVVDQTPVECLSDHALLHLPHWCVYIEVEREVDGRWMHGGFVTVLDAPDGHARAYFNAVLRNEQRAKGDGAYVYYTLSLNIRRDAEFKFAERRILSAHEAQFAASTDEISQYMTEDFTPEVALLLARAAALGVEKPDVRNSRDARAPLARKKNDGPVQEWVVGERFGTMYRRAQADHERETRERAARGERARPRPHVRQAHWRTVVSGPMKDESGAHIPAQERTRELRRFLPMYVNTSGDELPVTIWRVRGDE